MSSQTQIIGPQARVVLTVTVPRLARHASQVGTWLKAYQRERVPQQIPELLRIPGAEGLAALSAVAPGRRQDVLKEAGAVGPTLESLVALLPFLGDAQDQDSPAHALVRIFPDLAQLESGIPVEELRPEQTGSGLRFEVTYGSKLPAPQPVVGGERVADHRTDVRLATVRMSTVARVFVSSTVEDLADYRAAARDAATSLEFLPIMSEYFPSANNPPLADCLEKVRKADLLVVIAANRYGWIPPDQSGKTRKSITWLECEEAVRNGKDILGFIVDDDVAWPEQHREEFALSQAVRAGRATKKLFAEVQQRTRLLTEFKAWLGTRVINRFTSPDDLRAKVLLALQDRRARHHAVGPTAGVPGTATSQPDPTSYLRHVLDSTAYIDIRGLATGDAKAHRFPIDDLFVTLKAVAPAAERAEEPGGPARQQLDLDAARVRGSVGLETLLAHRTLVVIGDPGSGKSTFLRKVAQGLSRTLLGIDDKAARLLSGLDRPLFPILLRAEDLARYIAERQDERGASKPATRHSADWLPRFLARWARDGGWDLQKAFFQQKLKAGDCIVLIDGLDEASDRVARKETSRVIEDVALMYPACHLVVTSRPAAYSGEVVLSGFTHAEIESFDEVGIRAFLDRWCDALYRGQAGQADIHRTELEEAVTGLPQIRRLARNPVMLTALAVLHWNEKRLPEQRAELYESILTWLSRSREKRSGRLSAERCLAVLEQLALHMQSGHARERGRKGRRVQVPRRSAAEDIHAQFPARTRAEQVQLAERFLRDEELDSGIIIGRGDELRFWHLTFQEFLAAQAIARLEEGDQRKHLVGSRPRAYQPEWREVVLLFAGLLARQGRPKVDGFVKAVLDTTKKTPTLAMQSRCAGLLGSIVRDLAPLKYQIDDGRYAKLLDAVLGIFDPRRSAGIPINVRIEAAEALGQAGDPRLDPKHSQRWVKIPAGPFLMGAQNQDPSGPGFDPEALPRESPVHEVHVDAYAIARYPVTVAEFQTFLDDDGYVDSRWWTEGGFGSFDKPDDWDDQVEYPNRPVVGVSWFEAAAFARWSGCRLPTEAEWEKAARGTEGRKFPWGHEPADPSRLNYDGNVGRPTPVGLYPAGATPSGIDDLAGNVWEWCSDWWDSEYYSKSPKANPQGPDSSDGRVVRGGSWGFNSRLARSACRSLSLPDGRGLNVGFRVVVAGGARTR